MTYYRLKVLEFIFMCIFTALIYKMVNILTSKETLLDFSFVDYVIFPFLFSLIILLINGYGYQRSYYLSTKDPNTIRNKLFELGYQATADKSMEFFFKRRSFFGFRTARIEIGDKQVILHVMEKIPEFEREKV